jgi:lipopolysaccharide/colanic/teichoic acid biosynthesis glycosyltransferase
MSLVNGFNFFERNLKRFFDLFVSFFGLFAFGWLIVLGYFIAKNDTGMSGFFKQKRVGKGGKIFEVIKLRTMRPLENFNTCVTSSRDPRITRAGKILRKTKIDELPQLINVFKGEMSFVGPRPDVPGFADLLQGDDRIVLSVRPGITGPATLKYKNEEQILAEVENPEEYNSKVIFPDKVKINKDYIKNYSFLKDIKYIIQTLK